MKARTLGLGAMFLTLAACEGDQVNLPPADFAVIVADSSVSSLTLSWNEAVDPDNDAVHYRIYISEVSSTPEYLLVENDISGDNFIVTSLKANTQYVGKVVAYDKEGGETTAHFSSTTLDDNLPPREFVVEVFREYENSLGITWELAHDPENAEVHYSIYLSTSTTDPEYTLVEDDITYDESNGGFEWSDESGTIYGGAAVLIDGLTHNTDYVGKVVADDLEGGQTSSYFSASTLEDTTPPVLVELTIQYAYNINAGLVWRSNALKTDVYLEGELLATIGQNDTYDFNGLIEATTYTGKLILYDQNGLTTVKEFEFTTTTSTFIGDIELNFQSEVDNLAGSSIQTIQGDFTIGLYHSDMDDLSGIESLKTIDGDVWIGRNLLGRDDIPGLINVTQIAGDLVVHRISTDGLLPNLTTVNGNLQLIELLQDEEVFPNLIEIGMNVSITNTAKFDGLRKITEVGNLSFADCGVTSLDFLSELTRINGLLQLHDCSFASLSGLQNIVAIGGNVSIGSNDNLSDFCAISDLVINGGIVGSYSVYGNLYNPEEADLIDGNCKL